MEDIIRDLEKYRLSRDTLLRDVKVIDAIDTIGEISHGAKKKILSGKVKVEKSVLRSLSSWSRANIVMLAMMIEDGTYEGKN